MRSQSEGISPGVWTVIQIACIGIKVLRYTPDMSDVTRLLNSLSDNDDSASGELLEAIYGELRTMAGAKMRKERQGHTLQATALVNEAYLKLTGENQNWQNRRHFFGAASEAMRRILIDSARRKQTIKHGGEAEIVIFDEVLHGSLPLDDDRMLEVHEVLDQLEAEDARLAQIVKLRFFVGLTLDEIGEVFDLSQRTVSRHWDSAKIWLYRAIKGE